VWLTNLTNGALKGNWNCFQHSKGLWPSISGKDSEKPRIYESYTRYQCHVIRFPSTSLNQFLDDDDIENRKKCKSLDYWDWFQGKFTGNPHSLWEKPGLPADFPLNHPNDQGESQMLPELLSR
jgi:hypothetical protein